MGWGQNPNAEIGRGSDRHGSTQEGKWDDIKGFQ